jgi:hypothetical protein
MPPVDAVLRQQPLAVSLKEAECQAARVGIIIDENG